MQKKIYGNLVDILNQKIFPASIEIRDGYITNISKISQLPHDSCA